MAAAIEHRIGDAFVTIDVNESNNPGPGVRQCLWRVRRGKKISVYRSLIEHEMLPPGVPWDTAGYLLTQSHDGNLLWAYDVDPFALKP